MKKVVITVVVMAYSLTSFTQNKATQKERKTQFGFNLGGFQTFIGPEQTQSHKYLTEIKNSSGFRLGIVMNHKLGKKISIAPKAELGFSNGSITHSQIRDTLKSKPLYISKPLYNTHLELMTHFIWSETGLINSYVLIGPSIRIPLIKEDEISITNGYDVGIDIGIGFNKKLPYFNVMPELRFSNGLTNIFESNTLPKTTYSSISLVLNFIG